jgi:hypothetical protein
MTDPQDDDALREALPSNLEAAAVSLHELYTALIEAGFTDTQAIKLVGMTLMTEFLEEDDE